MRNRRVGLNLYEIWACALFFVLPAAGQELPQPTYQNAVIVSIEHDPRDSAAVDYIKQNLPFGLYAWLSFSMTSISPTLDWHAPLSEAVSGIAPFKNTIDSLIAAAKANNVKLHLVLTSGLARSVQLYKEAKEEDIRNAQWYNDNKLAADDQINSPDRMSQYIFGTLSRYARKVRANLEAKSKAAVALLKKRMDDNPDTLLAVSGWGEAELNYNRIDHSKSVQPAFCDYSPFTILEFRDWIQHAGLYDDAAGKFPGQGFSTGGAKYQGKAGLTRFNTDFNTNFETWDLRYFNWSLSDAYDQVPQDAVNNDPHKIPYSAYSHGNMLPTSGANFIAGGFDPPRVMQPGNGFWDLWNLFRETMVHHFVVDVAKWASEAGIAADQWYSHQIPADYLYGTNPGDPNKNARYFTSASPLWAADISPFGSAGATIYDIKFPPDVNPVEYVRTTSFVYPAISAMSSNWAAMEYDAETYPVGFTVQQSPPELILNEFLRLYSFRVHLINFWRWKDATVEHTIKGMNKETALKVFLRRIRDKARNTDLNVVYSPPRVTGVRGQVVAGASGILRSAQDNSSNRIATSSRSRVMARNDNKKIGDMTQFSEIGIVSPNSAAGGIELRLSGKIWAGAAWEWKDWGDFALFEIYRGTLPEFPLDAEHLVGKTGEYSFLDASVLPRKQYYYIVRAVNSAGVAGPSSRVIIVKTNPPS